MTTTPDPMNLMPHPTEETLAAFVDDRLHSAARRNVIEHIADCAECNDIVMTATEFQAGEPDMAEVKPPSRFTPRVTFAAAAVLAAAAVVILVFGPMLMQRKHEREQLDNLVDATHSLSTRRLLPRLSGGFPHKRYQSPFRGKGDEGGNDAWFVLTVKMIGEAPADDRVRATTQLLGRHYAAAVTTLERATAAKPRNPDLLNDLSAAYYARGDEGDHPSDFAAALDAANRAWAVKKTPEIAWNRALALSKRHDPMSQADVVAAARAWDDYLAIEQDPAWKAEGADRKKELSNPDSD